MTVATDYTATIGTVAGSGQVHLAHGSADTQHILCRFGSAKEATSVTLAECPGDGDVCDALLAAEVKVSKLCKNCFPVQTRKRYQARIRQAIDEERE